MSWQNPQQRKSTRIADREEKHQDEYEMTASEVRRIIGNLGQEHKNTPKTDRFNRDELSNQIVNYRLQLRDNFPRGEQYIDPGKWGAAKKKRKTKSKRKAKKMTKKLSKRKAKGNTKKRR
jgi:hypothetical protein